MRVLFIDAYNLIHRARFGFSSGPYSVVFNFFRGIRPLIEKFSPDKVYFVLEGHPKGRLELYPEYKMNRKAGMTPEKEIELEDFKRQKDIICNLVRSLPFYILYHPEYECDDVIANLAIHRHPSDECIILSNDTDYIQLHHSHSAISIYSPVKKDFLPPTEYDYVAWKALVGDASDNIMGVPRVGKQTAETLLKGSLNDWLSNNADKAEIFERNLELIRFADLSERLNELVILESNVNFEFLKEKFFEFEFHSMLSDKSWEKFVRTFEHLREGFTNET